MDSVLKGYEQTLLFCLSFLIVAFGQPAGAPWLTVLSALFGYAFFCRILLDVPSKKQRFWLGTLWFTGIQAVQLYWMLSHPFNYIYFVYASFSFMWGVQWGLFSLFVTPQAISSLRKIIGLAALWTLMEWSRLFFLSGYTWNPAGMALTEYLYPLQLVSMGGVFLLSFWVLFVNLTGLRAWLHLPKKVPVFLWIALAIFPYIFGATNVHLHRNQLEQENSIARKEPFRALLAQTAFPAEEALVFEDKLSYIAYVIEEWNKIFKILRPHVGKELDLIALPEYVVPFGTYTFLYPYETVENSITKIYGPLVKEKFPPLEEPFARSFLTNEGEVWFVNNAFWAQAIANIFQAEVIAGLEDAQVMPNGEREHYSAAIHFKPNATVETFDPQRYAKRVLLPMAEYIPLKSLHELAAKYGIKGSFTCGKEATIFQSSSIPFAVSICYEETFGHLMTECRQNGAELLVNLTSDVWYPSSSLPKQHFDHARMRSVENGVPVVRACNTGITSAFDSLGQVIAMLGDGNAESQWKADALYVEVPRYHYETLYSHFGDLPIILFCCFALLLLL
ncbi:MAG: apolipoprotein N-acyltransferase [Parachlamydiaceae bacterium]|nr:apolipoprotein N-acyltransferase [Parachlamydiaceae bacterium]